MVYMKENLHIKFITGARHLQIRATKMFISTSFLQKGWVKQNIGPYNIPFFFFTGPCTNTREGILRKQKLFHAKMHSFGSAARGISMYWTIGLQVEISCNARQPFTNFPTPPIFIKPQWQFIKSFITAPCLQ